MILIDITLKFQAKSVKWAIEIQKTSLENRNLSDLLDPLGFELVEGIEYPAMTSPEIDACLTPQDAFEKAKAVRDAFKGPAEIDPNFMLGSVLDYSTRPPKRHIFVEAESCFMAITTFTADITVSPPKGLSPTQLEQWHAEKEERQYQAKLEQQRLRLEPAYFSKRAAKVIELLSVDKPSAEILYKIYELAEEHPGNRKNFQEQFGITQGQFDRFRDAVHNPVVSGDWARHAYDSKPRTSNPMTREEAEAFVREISTKWLQSQRKAL